ncbi:MAG: PCRF domain-containing protein, partial [Candidatus Eisenbacteria bacterium]|nr:PCRF domain-containing protein [Candidatus Eisenbacteria bacterium]
MDDLLRGRERLLEQMEQINQELSDPKILKDQDRLKTVGRDRVRVQNLLEAMRVYQKATEALAEAQQ